MTDLTGVQFSKYTHGQLLLTYEDLVSVQTVAIPMATTFTMRTVHDTEFPYDIIQIVFEVNVLPTTGDVFIAGTTPKNVSDKDNDE